MKVPAFVPWSLPAAVGLATGVLLRAVGVPWWVLGLMGVGGWRWITVPWAVWLVVTVPLGYGRYALWESRPDPLDGRYGETVTLSGWSDGRILRLEEPRGARVVLSPRGVAPAGLVTVRGELAVPAGKRNPGGFDYRGYLRRRGVGGQLYVDEVLEADVRSGLKARLRLGVTRGLPPPQAALMEAMTLGVRDELGELRDAFAASGLAHLLALSGLHVGILMAALGWALRPLGLGRYPLMLVFVVGFIILVGPSPSVLRAGMMVAVVLLSLWLGAGRIEPWPALALAAFLTLLWQPAWIFDLSFQLSYLAVAGLLLFTGPLTSRLLGPKLYALPWWSWRKAVAASAVASVSAQALSLPLVASTFGSVPLVSPLVNVLAVPLAGLLVPLGFVAGLLGLLWSPLAGVLNAVTSVLAGWLIALATSTAGLLSLPWGEVSRLGYAYYAVALLGLFLTVRGLLKPWRGLLILCVAIVASTVSVPEKRPPEIVFLDVGQGDSTLIRLPGRREILIDGGGTPFGDFDVGARTVLPALRALGVDELELVIATHADADHIEGLASVLEGVPVRELIIGVPEGGRPVFDSLMRAAEAQRVPVREVLRGEIVVLGDARLDILNPPRKPYATSNDNSVAFVLYYRQQARALLMGDLSDRVEADLVFPQVDIVLAGHHGSNASTSQRLLEATQPEIVVISSGENRYGHPHPELLSRIEASGARTLFTRQAGAVRLPL
ncbi:MAG: DNA internalization-related competence protein ComEC/Rec2 [Trueperaceae bacterium]|nr:MAG: DNA internalization-related competence protein ComEC/Rec2 [Trueperaceae bacterium]